MSDLKPLFDPGTPLDVCSDVTGPCPWVLCRLLSFPTNLINASDTRRGIAKAFTLWSDVSPFSFREVPADEEADIKIGERLPVQADSMEAVSHAIRHVKV